MKHLLWMIQRHCAYCGVSFRKFTKTTLDHVHPSAKGGSDDIANLTLACVDCNSHKRDDLWVPAHRNEYVSLSQ